VNVARTRLCWTTAFPRARSWRIRWTRTRPTGDTIFVLDDFYESPTGVIDHCKQAVETWQDLDAFMEWNNKAKRVSTLHSATLVQRSEKPYEKRALRKCSSMSGSAVTVALQAPTLHRQRVAKSCSRPGLCDVPRVLGDDRSGTSVVDGIDGVFAG